MKLKILSDGWGLSLEKAPVFKRGEMDRHACKKLKPTLKMNIYTTFKQTMTIQLWCERCAITLFITVCKSVTELQHEVDEDCSVTCTSTLQRWHQPRVEGTTSCHIMEVPVSKTQSEGEHKSSGITCHLYEARRYWQEIKTKWFSGRNHLLTHTVSD